MGPEDVFRSANNRIADKAAESAWNDPIPFLCECSDARCFARLQLTLDEYRSMRAQPEHYLIQPSHELADGIILEQDERVAVVEKLHTQHDG